MNATAETTTNSGRAVQMTALLLAVRNKREEAVDVLLKHRADPNIATNNGSTPLMMSLSLTLNQSQSQMWSPSQSWSQSWSWSSLRCSVYM